MNDRAISLPTRGGIDLSAVVGEEGTGASAGISDAEAVAILEQETEVEIFVVGKSKARAGGAFFEYSNSTNFDLAKSGLFKQVGRNSYKHNCLL